VKCNACENDTSASDWLQVHQDVQSLADVVLGDACAFFLYRGKLYEPWSHGQYVSYYWGHQWVRDSGVGSLRPWDGGGTVDAVVVDDEGREPMGAPGLSQAPGWHLVHLWPNGHGEPVVSWPI